VKLREKSADPGSIQKQAFTSKKNEKILLF